MEKAQAKITGSELLHSGKWLKLVSTKYTDQTGKERVWETLERTTHTPDREVDAVEIVPLLKKNGKITHLIAIKQFRPPAGKYVIELPAGLLDSEEPALGAAVRELYEETGYVGTVADESMSLMFGMAISNTTCKIVTVLVDGDLAENAIPQQNLGEGEFCEVVLIPIGSILTTLEAFKKQDCVIDGKISMIGYGLETLPKLLEFA